VVNIIDRQLKAQDTQWKVSNEQCTGENPVTMFCVNIVDYPCLSSHSKEQHQTQLIMSLCGHPALLVEVEFAERGLRI
jgi:hypothetical protein